MLERVSLYDEVIPYIGDKMGIVLNQMTNNIVLWAQMYMLCQMKILVSCGLTTDEAVLILCHSGTSVRTSLEVAHLLE
jgi:hypothetical protein